MYTLTITLHDGTVDTQEVSSETEARAIVRDVASVATIEDAVLTLNLLHIAEEFN